jgi:nucleoside-diphosphate-sugar epimerase
MQCSEMKVLVTGARGFLGRYVIASLERRKIDYIAVARQPIDSALPPNFVSADLLSEKSAATIRELSATHLIHLAWCVEHGKYWSSRLNLDWVGATVRLVEAFCESGGKQVVGAGSCAEYEWSRDYCREDQTPLNPGTLYGVAKDATRRLVVAVCRQYQAKCAWARIFVPYGAGESNARLVSALAEVFKGIREPFAVNGDAIRDFIHASDVAEALVTLMVSSADGEYNVCCATPAKVEDVVKIVAAHFSVDPDLILQLERQRTDDPPFIAGDNTRLKSLGWSPQFSLEAWLDRTLAELDAGPQSAQAEEKRV